MLPDLTTYAHAADLDFTLLEGEAQLVRAANGTPAAATPTAAEAVPVGQELTLAAGDTVYYDGAAVQAERNDGDEPARRFVEATPAA